MPGVVEHVEWLCMIPEPIRFVSNTTPSILPADSAEAECEGDTLDTLDDFKIKSSLRLLSLEAIFFSFGPIEL
jgi:hypothetical protein